MSCFFQFELEAAHSTASYCMTVMKEKATQVQYGCGPVVGLAAVSQVLEGQPLSSFSTGATQHGNMVVRASLVYRN